MNMKGKDFLKLLDLTPEEIGGLIALAAQLKTEKKAEPKEGRKNTAKAAGRENGQVSVWDLMEGQNT